MSTSKPTPRLETLRLTQNEANSALWLKVRTHIAGERDTLLLANAKYHNADDTLKMRATIALCDRLLAAGLPPGLGDVVDDGDAIDEERG